MRRALLPLLLVPALVLGQGVRDERADVQRRLSTEKATLSLLKEQKVGVLEVLELVERLARASAARAQAKALQLRALQRRTEVAQRQEVISCEALRQQLERLSPRLTAMYRLMRRDPLDVLLTARDFSAMVRRSRALGRLLESDLALLEQVQKVSRFQQESVRQLEGLQELVMQQALEVKQESERALQERKDLVELIQLIRAEQNQSSRVIKELEQADRELTALIAELEQALPTSGFGALRGKLPLPADGVIEVGYGKVINPRFNTVTVQKGIDLRAALGTPVRAVALGKVAYAGWLRGYGNLLIVDHGDGFHTLMAHLAELGRSVGDEVKAGDVLGAVGDTGSLKGAYLYFELRQKGHAVDPALWLSSNAPAPAEP